VESGNVISINKIIEQRFVQEIHMEIIQKCAATITRSSLLKRMHMREVHKDTMHGRSQLKKYKSNLAT
jgi:hypothetical protein